MSSQVLQVGGGSHPQNVKDQWISYSQVTRGVLAPRKRRLEAIVYRVTLNTCIVSALKVSPDKDFRVLTLTGLCLAFPQVPKR